MSPTAATTGSAALAVSLEANDISAHRNPASISARNASRRTLNRQQSIAFALANLTPSSQEQGRTPPPVDERVAALTAAETAPRLFLSVAGRDCCSLRRLCQAAGSRHMRQTEGPVR